MPNVYSVGIGGTAVIWLNVIILAFLWRALSAKMVQSTNQFVATVGAAMGGSL